MTTTFELAAAKNRKIIEGGNRVLNYLIAALGILALGDFLYGWFAEDEIIKDWFAERELSEGLVVLVGLSALAGLCVWVLSKILSSRSK